MTTPTLLVIIPSRGRPYNIRRLHQAWKDTVVTNRVALLVCLDLDDPTLDEYTNAWKDSGYNWGLTTGLRNGFAPRLNDVACRHHTFGNYIASWGDDHVPRTKGWDEAILKAFDEMNGTGYVLTNDGHHGAGLATAWAQSNDIILALGYMTPPGLQHMYVDTVATCLAHATGMYRYLDDVIIEHMHPGLGKATHDALYAEGESHLTEDLVKYDNYMDTQFAKDVKKIRNLK